MLGRVIGLTTCALLSSANLFAQQAAPQAPFTNINPSWSPDGRKLVFESWRHGNGELYIINADGTGERRLTVSAANIANTHPSWSRDGKWIVFDSQRGRVWNLYVIKPDGTGERRITHAPDTTVTDYARHPEWSPDGRYIAFDSRRDGNGEIYVMTVDGKLTRRLTNTSANESHPLWTPEGHVGVGSYYSPDGGYVVYRSTTDSTPRLYVKPLDDSWPARAITPAGMTSYEAAWSRDGKRIAFYMDQTGKHELYVADADGRNVRQLTAVGH